MREASTMQHSFASPGKVLLVMAAIPVAALVGLLTGVFGLKAKRTAAKVATFLRDFVSPAIDPIPVT